MPGEPWEAGFALPSGSESVAGEVAEQWSAGKSASDGAVLHGEFGVWLHRAAQVGLASSIDGWTDDDIALSHSPWGFDPASISIPVKVWHGLEDRFVPFVHGRWLAEAIPGAQAELCDHEGHFTVVAGRIGEVHDWLAQYVGVRPSRPKLTELPMHRKPSLLDCCFAQQRLATVARIVELIAKPPLSMQSGAFAAHPQRVLLSGLVYPTRCVRGKHS